MSASNGITGKVGRWSARHPGRRSRCWIAFVAAAIVDRRRRRHEAAQRRRVRRSGESGIAARTLDKAGFKHRSRASR